MHSCPKAQGRDVGAGASARHVLQLKASATPGMPYNAETGVYRGAGAGRKAQLALGLRPDGIVHGS